MRKYYKYNKENLSYEEIPKDKIYSVVGSFFCFLFLTGFILGLSYSGGVKNKSYNNKTILTKETINPTKNKKWVDSTFKDYKKRADVYLSREIFKGTPLSGELLSLCARNTYDSTGILVPVEFALLQAQFESSMGLEGRSPKNNPFNIGESTKGTTQWFNTTFDGAQAYYYIMANNYLRCKTVEELLLNFTNCNGHRYAEFDGYESMLSSEYLNIKRWIDSNIN